MEKKYSLISAKYKEFFLPTLAMTMANNLALFVDSVLVSGFLGISKMPAIQLCFPVVAFVNMFYWMIGLGGSLMASNSMADHDREEACRFFSVSIVTVIAIGTAFSVLGSVFSGSVISLLCREATLTKDVREYFGVMILGFPLLCLLMSLSYFARADGRPAISFQAILISNIVNLCMDAFLLRICGMGIGGAALATILGYVCGILYMLRYLLWKDRQFRFVNPLQGSFFLDVGSIASKGFSTASSQLYITICSEILNVTVTTYGGTIGLQTFSMYNNSLFLAYMLFIGTAQTLSPIVSVYAHEGDYNRARYVLKKSLKIVMMGAVALAALFAVFPQILLALYHVEEAKTAAECVTAIRMFVLAYPGLAFFYIMSYYFQAIKMQKLAGVLTVLESFVFPVVFICSLSLMFGMTGTWIGVIAAETIPAAVILVLLLIRRRKEGKEPKTSFWLPIEMDENRYEFTVSMTMDSAVQLSREASDWIAERINKKAALRICLALEEMLTGIVMANKDNDYVVDVVLREEKDLYFHEPKGCRMRNWKEIV